ncbi:MAG: hypothetical protein GY853_16170 [PVC group bacterium]|nr:hypothetical protein [PVC group bacterium]
MKTVEEIFLEEKKKRQEEESIINDTQMCLICGSNTYTNIKICEPCFERYKDIFI